MGVGDQATMKIASATCAGLRVGLFLALASCSHSPYADEIARLGPETTGVPVGEFHRAGQPCTTCHRPQGSASPFSLAGTIFAEASGTVGVFHAEVDLVDSKGTKFAVRTNCVGNFFVTPDAWSPVFPVLVRVVPRGSSAKEMLGAIPGSEPSCTSCHAHVPGVPSPVVRVSDEEGPSKDCPVNPALE